MPRRCSVAGCRSNYDDQGEYVAIFSIPKVEPLRSQWLQNIPNDLSMLKHPVVCSKHFEEWSIIRTDTVIVNGEIKIFERKVPKLIPEAVPVLFPNVLSHLSSGTKSRQTLADVKQENLGKVMKQSMVDHKQRIKKITFDGINDILSYLNTDKKGSSKDKWIVLDRDEKLRLCFYQIHDDCPVILACVVIRELLDCDVYINKVQIPKSRLPKTVSRINNNSTLEKLMMHVEQYATHPRETEPRVTKCAAPPRKKRKCTKQYEERENDEKT